jgi:hypothetical protein
LEVNHRKLVFDVVEVVIEFGLDAVQLVEVDGAVVLLIGGGLGVPLQVCGGGYLKEGGEE